MLIEKHDAILALEILRERYRSAGCYEGSNALQIAIGDIERLKETPPKFYLIEGRKENENTVGDIAIDVTDLIGRVTN